jgi:peptide-methionine (S)-S-oxide reductase
MHLGQLEAAVPLPVATFAGGCFWCLEAVFQETRGVRKVESGYTGGHVDHPAYEEVCGKETGHAEAVRLTYDPDQVSYRDLLEVFFAIHNPTTLNRQGDDVGPQYRSAIFFHSVEQEAEARALVRELAQARLYEDPIVTEIVPAGVFWIAEDYHQDYFRHHTTQPYCLFVVGPKLKKFRQRFGALRQSEAP